MSSKRSNDLVDPLLDDVEGQTELLLGNEAIVRGALEAGVAFACGYPGTPSSEITDSFSRLAPRLGISFEYSVNEKIALEMAFAASLAGARSIVAMKHLGLTYAGDPLSTIPYVGVVGGMVIVSAGDPSCRTSPNEADQRHLAEMLHIPVLDPSTPQEALEMTRFAFELSEQSQLPVLLRPTTRLCHARSAVRFGRLRRPQVTGFERAPGRFVPIPVNARRLRIEIKHRIDTARKMMAESGFCRRSGSGRTAILCTGVPAATSLDLIHAAGLEDQVTLITVGGVHPLPTDWLVRQLADLDTVLVVEELSPFLEDAVRALCALHDLHPRILGKRTNHLPVEFEYEPPVLQRAFQSALGLGDATPAPERSDLPPAPPPRPPILCAGCPHRSTFFAVKAVFGEETLYFNDIGCYSLGYGPPLDTADALLCMGAGFTLAAGVSRVTDQRTVGFMGDSTFFHSGMPALLNAIKENVNMVAVILDNGVTAMTGFQESPTVQVERGRLHRKTDIETVVRALGALHVEKVDPHDLTACIEAFRRARDTEDLSVVIAEHPCPVFLGRVEENAAEASEETKPSLSRVVSYVIDQDRCQHCGREATGHRCNQCASVPYERAMAWARSREIAQNGKSPPAVAPCAASCPLFLCVQGYAACIAAGQYADALELIMSGLPLPESVCRVCHRPCETVCVRAGIDEPVAINDLKRFVMNWANAQDDFPYQPQLEPSNGMQIAVVGAGPSGLATAQELTIRGYAVTLFDAGDAPGGMLLSGIPEYRLPREALRRDIERILQLGVKFEGRRTLGKNLRLAALLETFDAVYLATGAQRSLKLDLPGDPGPPVLDALTYLRRLQEPRGETRGGHVVVLGGGNSAIDASRVALRSGAEKVTIACLESREEMPAISTEIVAAEREGVEIQTRRRATRRFARSLELARVEPREPGVLSPDNFDPIPGTEVRIEADQIISAFGHRADPTVLGEGDPGLEWTEDGSLRIDARTGQTSHPRVFSGGDLAAGERTVTHAIACGLRAAWGVDRSLRGEERANQRRPPPRVQPGAAQGRPGVSRVDRSSRHHPPEVSPSSRLAGFEEVVGVLTEARARAEAERCMICGQCGKCRSCVELFGCPAFYLKDRQIHIDSELCVGCGVCAEFCPNGAIEPRVVSSGAELSTLDSRS